MPSVHSLDPHILNRAIRSLPERFKGPGGAVGVVENGKVIAVETWGYADLASAKPMSPTTRMPICSISKQFTCGVLLDLVGDPARLDGRVADFLPNLEAQPPRVVDLCNMQSGLRDYWAMTVLHGAHPEGVFRREDAAALVAAMRTQHFQPGSRYSYSNGNFRILADLLEEHAGRSLAELYEERLFALAGMETALLTADTSTPADGVVGYEGNEDVGFFPATNRIYWMGDAGISASLQDMLAWERYIDTTRDDPVGLYRRLSEPQTFSDGKPASYGFGLVHERIGDVALTGHGGALRGFRLQRLYAPSLRLSVVVLFNHEADAHEAANMVMRAALAQPEAPTGNQPIDPSWTGDYLDKANGLLLKVSASGSGLNARYATTEDRLVIEADGSAVSPQMRLKREGDGISLERQRENLSAVATRVAGDGCRDLPGRYYTRELEGTLEIDMAGSALFGCFQGKLGRGPMHNIYAVGMDVFTLSCQRAMDAPAPGDWTIQVERNEDGGVCGLTIGCWLARNVSYQRM